MATLVHSETSQSVTLDDATGFLAAMTDPEKWIEVGASIEVMAQAVIEDIAQAIEHPIVTAEAAIAAVEAAVEPEQETTEPASDAPAAAPESIFERVEHAIEDAAHKIEGVL